MPPCPRPPQGCHSCGGVGSGDAVSCLFLGLCCVGLGLTSKRGRDGCWGLCPLSSHPSPPHPGAAHRHEGAAGLRGARQAAHPDERHHHGHRGQVLHRRGGRYCMGVGHRPAARAASLRGDRAPQERADWGHWQSCGGQEWGGGLHSPSTPGHGTPQVGRAAPAAPGGVQSPRQHRATLVQGGHNRSPACIFPPPPR